MYLDLDFFFFLPCRHSWNHNTHVRTHKHKYRNRERETISFPRSVSCWYKVTVSPGCFKTPVALEMWVRTAVWPRFIKRPPPLARSWLTFPLSNHNPLCFIVHLKAVCGQRCSGAAVVIGETSFPVTVQASEFVFAKCPCRWEDGGRWEELCVLFTDGSDRNPNPNRGEREGGDRSGVLRVVGWGVTVWRGKVCWSVIGTTHIHTHTFLLYAVHSHLQRQGYFRRALLNLYSLPMCSVYTYGVEGWRTEPNVSTRTPSLCGAAEKTSCLTERESEQEKAIYFTVFRDAYNVVVSQEIMIPKKEYCMSAFSDQSFSFLFLLLSFIFPLF